MEVSSVENVGDLKVTAEGEVVVDVLHEKESDVIGGAERLGDVEKRGNQNGQVAVSVNAPTTEVYNDSVGNASVAELNLAEVLKVQGGGFGNVNLWREEDILQLEKRLMLKIEASRWALERDQLLKSSVNFQDEIEPRDHVLLARARELTNCYLWMNNPETAPSIETEAYQMLADAYSAAACCVGFMRELVNLVDRSPKSEILSRILRDALYITATAQSALRRVTYDVSGREDQDQIRIHRWLTYLTKRYCIYVNRHMKKDSLAPKDRIYVIPEYIGRLRKEVEKLGQRQKILTSGFRRIQYHVTRIQEQGGGEHDWMKIINTVDELVDAGIPANDNRFEELLKGILPTLAKAPSYKEHPFFINILMELDYWRENEEEKALVKQELSAMPPQPTVTAGGDHVEKYTSVWDEMERCEAPAQTIREAGIVGAGNELMENCDFAEQRGGRFAENWNLNRMAEGRATDSWMADAHGYGNRGGLYRDAVGGNYQDRVASEMENPMMRNGERKSVWEREAEFAETGTTFANFSSAKRAQGFGSRILGNREPESERMGMTYRNAMEMGNRSMNSGYSRFATHPGIPSYDNVVARRAQDLHREVEAPTPEPVPQVEISPEELLAQVQKMVGTKKILLLDGNSDSEHWAPFLESLGGMVVFAGEEYTESEIKLAQLVHPGDVAVVMLVEGTVSADNRNVEFYCRRYDKPLLRVGRELELGSFARQVKATLALYSLSGN